MPELPFEPNRRQHKKKTPAPDRQLEILQNTHWGTLATVSADGEPYAVPIGFAYDAENGQLYFHTAPQGHKIENLARDNRVCFSIVGSSKLVAEKFSSTFESLLVFGRFERIADPAEALAAARLFCHKFAPGTTAGLLAATDESGLSDFAMMMEKAADFMAMYRLIPTHISGKQRQKA